MLKKNKKKWKEKIDWRAEIPLLFLFSLGCLLFISLVVMVGAKLYNIEQIHVMVYLIPKNFWQNRVLYEFIVPYKTFCIYKNVYSHQSLRIYDAITWFKNKLI